MKSNSPEFKGLIDTIVQNLTRIFSLQPFMDRIRGYIRDEYEQGIEASEIEFDMNFLPSDQTIEFLNDYVEGNINAATDALGESLRGEISRGVLSGEKVSDLKKRIRTVFRDNKFNNRLKTILRTESLRANNYGALEGAKQSGIPMKKYLSVIRDDVTSDICVKEDGKYGDESKAIDLEKPFIVRVNNKTIREQAPPFHPNCRSVIMFTRKKR